jgi:hypothetical protein
MEFTDLWDYLLDNEIASEETLHVVTDINGASIQTLNDVLYVQTGCRTVTQHSGEDEDE